jgi:6-pyruvoyltetrahydropterin/6-carboxytetrahydropterin synthase
MKIGKKFKFDAAHFIPNHPGKCRNLHGHTYQVEVELEGPIDPETGMVVDFGEIKEEVGKLMDKLDHCCLNDVLHLPTAENIAIYLRFHLLEFFVRHWKDQSLAPPVNLSYVKVWEGPDSYVSISREDTPLLPPLWLVK